MVHLKSTVFLLYQIYSWLSPDCKPTVQTAWFASTQISFGWSTVKIDMSAVRRFQPLMPFSVPAFAATLFALGLALGTTIAVGMLFFVQVSLLSCGHCGACDINKICLRYSIAKWRHDDIMITSSGDSGDIQN